MSTVMSDRGKEERIPVKTEIPFIFLAVPAGFPAVFGPRVPHRGPPRLPDARISTPGTSPDPDFVGFTVEECPRLFGRRQPRFEPRLSIV